MPSATRKECLKHILDKTSFMNQLVDEFLDVSCLESGNPIQIEKSPVNISDIARKVLQQHQDETDQHDFQLGFTGEQGDVLADPRRLHQLFENLIGNAIKYSPDGGRIEVKGERCAEHYQVCISDEGIGMSPEQQAQIFGKYYRAKPAKNAVKGLGIGLYFVKNIIELHTAGESGSKVVRGEAQRFTLPCHWP